MPAPPLDALILDDPLQSLDEINLLGMVDLFRRAKAQRQLIIATHDHRFAALLRRKLRPVSMEQTLALVRLEDWQAAGPIVHQEMDEGTSETYRIVA
jgi:ABC-type lipoprotein export system ATPase subunit